MAAVSKWTASAGLVSAGQPARRRLADSAEQTQLGQIVPPDRAGSLSQCERIWQTGRADQVLTNSDQPRPSTDHSRPGPTIPRPDPTIPDQTRPSLTSSDYPPTSSDHPRPVPTITDQFRPSPDQFRLSPQPVPTIPPPRPVPTIPRPVPTIPDQFRPPLDHSRPSTDHPLPDPTIPDQIRPSPTRSDHPPTSSDGSALAATKSMRGIRLGIDGRRLTVSRSCLTMQTRAFLPAGGQQRPSRPRIIWRRS